MTHEEELAEQAARNRDYEIRHNERDREREERIYKELLKSVREERRLEQAGGSVEDINRVRTKRLNRISNIAIQSNDWLKRKVEAFDKLASVLELKI